MALIRQQGMLFCCSSTADSSVGGKLPTLRPGLLSWIPQLWNVTEDQVLESAGLDAYVVSLIIRSGV